MYIGNKENSSEIRPLFSLTQCVTNLILFSGHFDLNEPVLLFILNVYSNIMSILATSYLQSPSISNYLQLEVKYLAA